MAVRLEEMFCGHISHHVISSNYLTGRAVSQLFDPTEINTKPSIFRSNVIVLSLESLAGAIGRILIVFYIPQGK